MTFQFLTDFLERQVDARASAIATVFQDRTQTFAELQARAHRMAAAMAAHGLRPGDRVGYFALNSDHFFTLLFACAYGGQVLAGINWRLAPPEVAYIVNDADVKLLITEPGFLPIFEDVRAQCPQVNQVVMVEDLPAWQATSQWAPPFRHPSDVVLQLYTSGTTGFPKGALIAHRALVAGIAKWPALGEDWAVWDETDVALVPMPVFHIGGCGWGLHGLCNGGRAVILARPDIEAILAAIDQHKVTKMFAVPAVLNALLNHPLAQTADVTSMREVVYGASPIPPDVLRRALARFGCQFVQNYGMTETAGTIVYLPPEDHDVAGNQRMLSAGKPLPGVEVRVVDLEGNDVPTGSVGEIWLRTDQIMEGYWGKPEATAQAITSEGWYRSGDAGYVDADGYVYMHDRVKDMIVSGAENIYPAEVENVLHDHPAVQDCAVIGVPDDKWGEAVKAIIVLRAGHAPDADAILTFARTRIAGYKVPKSIDFMTELPRNPSGKILKRELRKPYWPEGGRQVG
jgi:acyl-CoA synthetase (AMP-forming)/AMP-acid ligase II